MERPVHRLYVATFDLRRVVWELYAVISKSGAGMRGRRPKYAS